MSQLKSGPKMFYHYDTPKTVFFNYIVAKYEAGAGLEYILSLSDPDDTTNLENEHLQFLIGEGLSEDSCLVSALTGIMDYEDICECLNNKYEDELDALKGSK